MDAETSHYVDLLMESFTNTMTARMDLTYTEPNLIKLIVNLNISNEKKEIIVTSCIDALSSLDPAVESLQQMKTNFYDELVGILEARMNPPAQNAAYGF